jgi:DNA-binding MarR family transcriptional regulator
LKSPAVKGTPDLLIEAVDRLIPLYNRWAHAGLADSQVSPARAKLLGVLENEGPSTQKALSEALVVSPRNITKLVDGLEADGLVVRRPHPTDRRAVLVDLTDAGLRVSDEVCAEHRRHMASLFASLPEADRKAFGSALDRLNGELASRLSAKN